MHPRGERIFLLYRLERRGHGAGFWENATVFHVEHSKNIAISYGDTLDLAQNAGLSFFAGHKDFCRRTSMRIGGKEFFAVLKDQRSAAVRPHHLKLGWKFRQD